MDAVHVHLLVLVVDLNLHLLVVAYQNLHLLVVDLNLNH
jgi:hypothetical protein